MFAVVLLLVIASAPYAKDYVERRRCGKHLAAICQAIRVWTATHNGALPDGFPIMSNELASPRLLLCPADKSREPAANWQTFTSANSSYQIWPGAFGAKDFPPEMLQNIPYLQCKVHFGNSANAFGKVWVYSRPIPFTTCFLADLAIVILFGRLWWHHYKRGQDVLPGCTAAGALLPRVDQVRHDYLAARATLPTPWYRKGLVAAARRAVRALGFFRDRESAPQGRENPRAT